MNDNTTPIRITHVYRPKSLAEWKELANILCESSFAPRDYKNNATETLACLLFGTELGLAPLQALQNISTGRGKPNIGGDAALALALNHPAVQDIVEYVDGPKENRVGHCLIKFRNETGRKDLERIFSYQDAVKAGLIARAMKAKASLEKKGYHDDVPPWLAYPERMLIMRSRGFALRDGVADALKGLILHEEAQDYPAEEVRTVEREAELTPSPVKEAAKTPPDQASPPPASSPDPVKEPAQEAPPAAPDGQNPDQSTLLTEKQRRMLWAIAKKHGKDMAAFKEAFKVAHLEDIPSSLVNEAKAWLEDPTKGKSPIPGKKDAPAAPAQGDLIPETAVRYLREGMDFCEITDVMFKAKMKKLPEALTKAEFNTAKAWLDERADSHAEAKGQKEGA